MIIRRTAILHSANDDESNIVKLKMNKIPNELLLTYGITASRYLVEISDHCDVYRKSYTEKYFQLKTKRYDYSCIFNETRKD